MLGLVLCLVAAMATGPTAGAGTSNTAAAKAKQAQIGQKISDLRGQLDEVSGDESDLLGQLDDINNRKAALDSQITDLDQQTAAVQAQLDASTEQLAQAQQQAKQAQVQLNQAQTELAVSRQKMQEQAVDAYMGHDSSQDLAKFVLLRAGDMRQVAAAGEYLQQAVSNREAVVAHNRDLEGEAKDLAAQLKVAEQKTQSEHDLIVGQQTQLADQRAEQVQLRQQAQTQADAQNTLLAQVEQKRADFQAQIDSLQVQSDSIAAMLLALQGITAVPTPAAHGIFSDPAPGAPLTSPFGMRLDPVLGVYQLHAGQDFGVASGTPIHAAADGTVVSVIPAASSGGYGNYTCISHGGGLATCYAHQSQFLVTVGQQVVRGQVIGLSGSTGYSTGPHLHFEVRVNGVPVNPLPYL